MRGSETDKRIDMSADFTQWGGMGEVGNANEVDSGGGVGLSLRTTQATTQETTLRTTQETTQRTTRQIMSSRVWIMGESRDRKCGKCTADGSFRLHGRDRNRRKSRDRNRTGGKRFGHRIVCGKDPAP